MSKIFSFSDGEFCGGEVAGGSVEGTVPGEDAAVVGIGEIRGEFCPAEVVSFIISSGFRGTGTGRRTSAAVSFSGSFADVESVFFGDSRMISFFSSGFSRTEGDFGGYAEEIPDGVSEDVPEDAP